MKKTLAYLITFLNLASSALADESAWIESIAFQSVVANKYLAKSIGFTVYNKPVIQSSLSMSLAGGFHIDLWNSTPFKEYNKNFGTECDFGVGWVGFLSAVNSEKGSGVIIDVGFSYFDEPGLFQFGAQDALYTYVKLSRELGEGNFYAVFENYSVMAGSSYPGGNHFGLGVDKSKFFPNDSMQMALSVDVIYDTGALGFNQGLLLRGGLSFDWKLSKHLGAIFPKIEYCMPVTGLDRPSDLVFGAGFSLE